MRLFDKKTVLNVLIGSILGIVLAGLLLLFIRPSAHSGIILLPTRVPKNITVYLTGEILEPGVFPLPVGVRVKGAINAADGFSENADQQAVNLAAVLKDEDRIVVPGKNSPPVNSLTSKTTKLININNATVGKLEDFPAIGAVKAQAIIEYRDQNGSFLSIEDIMKVPGIEEEMFNQFKGQISINP